MINLLNLYPQISCLLKTAYLSAPIYALPLLSFTLRPPLFYIHFFIMRLDRIIVGEVRGGEALDMLQAMNTGHDGSLSTGHSNSPKDMLSRIETMALSGADLPLPAIRSQIAGALDIIVHLGRLRDRSRRVLEIVEVGEYRDGEIELFPLFSFEETGSDRDKVVGSLKPVGVLKNTQKLVAAGYQL